MADKSETKESSDICNLPAELLHEVLSNLDNASLVQLGLTCKSLNYVSLNTYFKKNNMRSPSSGWFVAFRTPPETLFALRAALWVKGIKQLHFYFSPGIDELVAEVVDMYWLVKRLSSVEVVKLHFSLDTCYRLHKPGLQSLDSRRWFEAFINLLEIIIKRGCNDLQITGAGISESMYKVRSPAESSCSATLTSTEDREMPADSISVPNGQGSQGGISHPSSTSNKKKGLLSKICSPTTLFRLISRKPRTKIGIPLMTGLPKQSNHYSTELVDAAEKSSSDTPYTQPCRPCLANIGILSDMLFQPTFFDWTVKMLTSNSFLITKLSLQCFSLTTKTWSALLRSVTLPHLQNFEIATGLAVNTNAAFMDLQDFFVRHPNIDTLHLERLPDPQRIAKSILPNLVCMTAPPGWVSNLLDMQYSHGSLSKLNSIGISTEYYFAHNFDYDLLDTALLHVAKFSGRRVTLTLLFMCKNNVSHWFLNHVAFGKENSVLSRLYCVSTLVISTAFFVDITTVPKPDLLTWFSLFPCVEHLKFVESVEKQRVLFGEPEFLKSIAERCPQIKSIEIQQVIDLDEYRSR